MITVATTQMACTWDMDNNIHKAESLVRKAANQSAQIILLQELFLTPYFCQDQNPDFFKYALEVEGHPALSHFSELAKELSVVLPISFYERANNALYNSVMMIDSDGTLMGVYRKTHIPHDDGYWEKLYFTPGDTGFKVWSTRYGKVGVGICWDQWFPECARAMALMGADILMYPTAIGSQPSNAEDDSQPQWQRVMQGHAIANRIPICASNRVGTEKGKNSEITFYGSSFISDHAGINVVEADRKEETILVAAFDFDEIRKERDNWTLFRDRRPTMYDILLSKDGRC